MARQSIGVFDSGVGGLTVVRALRKELPAESLIYLGDTARLPYGNKSADTVRRYSRKNIEFLLEREVKLVLIACNTASAVALPALADELPVPVLGAVGPGAAAAVAATHSGHVGVIGTLGTVRSGAYVRAIAALSKEIQVAAQACPLFVPLAEEGWTEEDVTVQIARRYLSELKLQDSAIDTIVLGCTHYPILKPALQMAANEVFGRSMTLVDSADVMAKAARSVLTSLQALASESESEPVSTATNTSPWRPPSPAYGLEAPGKLTCFVTDHARIDELGSRFLGEPLGAVEVVDL